MSDRVELKPADRPASARHWLTLALLGSLYVLSFVDRYMLALVVEPLKRDLGIGNVAIGLLFGTVFATFYAITSLPLARIADNHNRKWLIAGAVAVWSICTFLSGFATNFAMLATLRFGLAVGEAALVPAALSLLADLFPARSRVLAATLFSTVGMAGAAGSFVIGGFVVQQADAMAAAQTIGDFRVWQLGLMMVGLPGAVLAVLVALFVDEPARRGRGAEQPSKISEVWAYVKSEGMLYPGLFIGGGFALIVPNGLVAWGPTYLVDGFGIALGKAGIMFGIAHFVAGVGGSLLVPLLIERVTRSRGPEVGGRVPAVISIAGSALVILGPVSGSLPLFLVCHAIGSLMLIGTGNAVVLTMQPYMPARMRAVLTATALIFVSSFAFAVGPPLVAWLAQLATFSAVPLRWGIAGVALLGLVGAAPLFLLVGKRYARALETLRVTDDGAG